MPTPATWTSNLSWDSTVTWDGMVNSPRRTMSNTKAIIDFSGFTAGELGPIAQMIKDKMTLNAATFPNPSVSMTALQTLITTYDQKLVARASRATADILAFREAREALEDALGSLGNDVNSVAKGEPAIVALSGFPSYETTRTPDTAPPPAPADLRLRQGDLSGSVVARYKPARHPSTNEMQTNLADPNIEAGWHTKGLFQGGKAEMDGFTPGTVVWFRVRTVGLKGVMGAWSDPAQIRIL